MKLFILYICWLNCFLDCIVAQHLEVSTKLGTIAGKLETFSGISVRTFLGIPYAQPPVGEKRFKKPFPTESWTGSFKADHLPPGCVQYSSNPFPWYDDLPGKSLDCLYLNIWAPVASDSIQKAVFFSVHPGGFRIGSSRLDSFDGRVLAALGGVIVVTINYRLGVEGFLYSGTEDAPGNMGLLDILEALKWVQSNIGYFGGDKGRVTFVGQSAGAVAASMLMTSPLAEGLFSRAILESGSADSFTAEENGDTLSLSQAVAESVGCASKCTTLKSYPEKVVQCLRGNDGLELVKVMGKVSEKSLYPRYGDAVLPRNVRKSITEGIFRTMDILIGSTSNEGATIITKTNTGIFGFFGQKADKVNKTFAEELIRKNFRNFSGREAVVKHYLGNVEEGDEETSLNQVQAAAGDYPRVCPSVYLAERVAAKNSSVYYYFFSHRPSPTPFAPWMGAIHVDERAFAFGYPLRYPHNYTASERRLSEKMLGVWTNFVKTGSPSLEPWPLYSESHTYRVFDTKGKTLGIGPHLENCEFFRPYFEID